MAKPSSENSTQSKLTREEEAIYDRQIRAWGFEAQTRYNTILKLHHKYITYNKKNTQNERIKNINNWFRWLWK